MLPGNTPAQAMDNLWQGNFATAAALSPSCAACHAAPSNRDLCDRTPHIQKAIL